MARRHDNLFPQIANFEALRTAARRAIRGKRKKRGGAAFQFALERELLKLERELLAGTCQTGQYVEIHLTRPRKRLVSAAPLRDRVAQHALPAIAGPVFERGFIGNTSANRVGKGTHKAIAAYETCRDSHAHVLRCDIFRYFPASDHEILNADLRRRIRCQRALRLMDTIIDGSNEQEPVNLHFPGDDLLTPELRRRGLPIRNLMRQFSANVYLDPLCSATITVTGHHNCRRAPLDHFCTEVLRAPYVRYVEDFALFADDIEKLADWQRRIDAFLVRRRLRLHPRMTFITETAGPGRVSRPGPARQWQARSRKPISRLSRDVSRA